MPRSAHGFLGTYFWRFLSLFKQAIWKTTHKDIARDYWNKYKKTFQIEPVLNSSYGVYQTNVFNLNANCVWVILKNKNVLITLL